MSVDQEIIEELRVRRLVVVDSDGHERITTTAYAGGTAGIFVHHPELEEGSEDSVATVALEAGLDVEGVGIGRVALTLHDGKLEDTVDIITMAVEQTRLKSLEERLDFVEHAFKIFGRTVGDFGP